MTVCIATDGFPPDVGGIATFNFHLSRILTNEGHQVIALYIGYSAERDEEDTIIQEGNLIKVILKTTYFKILDQWRPYFSPGGFDAPNWIAIGLSMREWLLNNHLKYKIEIIEASDYGGCGIFLIDNRLPPLVITGHGSLIQYSRYNYAQKNDHFRIITKLESLSFTNADAVIAHSNLNQRDLQTLFTKEILLAPIPWSNLTVLKESTTTEAKIIVVGGLQPVKGIYEVMEALNILKTTNPEIEITWVGGDTFLAPGQKRMSEYLSKKYPEIWQKTLQWKGELDFSITQQQIADAALVIIPSTFETFNYVALEAASYRKAMIIATGAGVADLFIHDVDAYLVPPNDPITLSKAIIHLSSNPVTQKKFGEHAYLTLIKKSHAENIIQKRLFIYETIIRNRRVVNKLASPDYYFIYKYKTSFRKSYYSARKWLKNRILRRQ